MEINTSTSMGELAHFRRSDLSHRHQCSQRCGRHCRVLNRPVDVVNTIKKGSLKVMSPVRVLADGEDLNISIYVNMLPGKKHSLSGGRGTAGGQGVCAEYDR